MCLRRCQYMRLVCERESHGYFFGFEVMGDVSVSPPLSVKASGVRQREFGISMLQQCCGVLQCVDARVNRGALVLQSVAVGCSLLLCLVAPVSRVQRLNMSASCCCVYVYMYVNTYIYIHIRVYIYVYTCIHMYIWYTYVYTCICGVCAYICIHIYTRMYISTYVCIYRYVYINAYTCIDMSVCMCIYMYIHIYV